MGIVITPDQALRALAGRIGSYRFRGVEDLIDRDRAIVREILTIANNLVRPEPARVSDPKPSVVDKYIGRRRSYGIHEINGRPIVVEKRSLDNAR